MKHSSPCLWGALFTMTTLLAGPMASLADTGGSAAACAAMGETFLGAHTTFQNNREASLTFFQRVVQASKETLQAEQRLLEAQQNKMAVVRQNLETLREATVRGGSGQAAVDRYNEMIRESNGLRQDFDRWTERYQGMLADYNQLVALYNQVAGDPAQQGCGDYLPKVASFQVTALAKFDPNQALTLCAEENHAIEVLDRARAEIEASPCEGLIASLPRFEHPRRTDLRFLPQPAAPSPIPGDALPLPRPGAPASP